MSSDDSLSQLGRLNLNLLFDLDAILMTGSLTAAASRRFVTQPAMSGALSKLRRMLGDEILVRSGRGYQLTTYAANLRDPLRDTLLKLQGLIKDGLEFDPGMTRTFTVAASDYAIAAGLGSMLAQLGDKDNNIAIRHIGSNKESYSLLDSGDIDLLIAPTSDQPSTRHSQRFLTDPYVFMCARGAMAPDEELTVERFQAFKHVSYGPHGTFGESVSEQAIATLGIPRNVALTVQSLTAIPLILTGTNLGAVVPSTVSKFAGSLDLETRALPFEVPPLQEDLVWHGRSASDPAHTWLRDQIIRSGAVAVGLNT